MLNVQKLICLMLADLQYMKITGTVLVLKYSNTKTLLTLGSKCWTKEERTIRYVEDQRQSCNRLDVSDHELAVVDVEGRVVAVEEGASKTPGVLREVLRVRRLERCDADRHSHVLEL